MIERELEDGRATTDEWNIDRLDLSAYLRRIDYAFDTTPNAQTLAKLHRAHLAAIPFENLDVVLGRGVDVELDSVQAKLVHRRRGGYCYEHALLFAAALERLGYPVDRLLARVGGDVKRPRPRTHMALQVHAGAGRWLADVGFGSGLLEPLSFDAGGAHTQGGWTFELSPTAAGAWQLRERQGRDWVTRYSLDEQRLRAADVVMANHFTSTYPHSPFVGQLVVVRRDADSTCQLIGRRLTITLPDQSTDERWLSDREFADALHGVFNLSLSPEELTQLIAAVPLSATEDTP
jgi:N-hydroxyarylamine O-acetyltransferase